MTYDSAVPMRKVLSFLMGSHEKSLTHHLGSDRERKGKRQQKKEIEIKRLWDEDQGTLK